VSRTKIDTYYHDESRVRFFESENESDLADSILLLYRDPQLRKKLASNASQYIDQNNWQEKRRDYFHLVDRLGSPRAEAKR
jgi:hypothetical protein